MGAGDKGGRVDYDPKRKKPYKTGELARILDFPQRTVIRMIDQGDFGPEGFAWKWTKAGPGKGDRKVYAAALREYLERKA